MSSNTAHSKVMPLRDCTQARQSLENQRGARGMCKESVKVTTHNPYGVNVFGSSIDDEDFAFSLPYTSKAFAECLPSSRPVPTSLPGRMFLPTQEYHTSNASFGSITRVYQNGRPVPVLSSTGKCVIPGHSAWLESGSDACVASANFFAE